MSGEIWSSGSLKRGGTQSQKKRELEVERGSMAPPSVLTSLLRPKNGTIGAGSLCVHARVPVCADASLYLDIWVHVCRGQKATWDVVLQVLSTLYFEPGSLAGRELTE